MVIIVPPRHTFLLLFPDVPKGLVQATEDVESIRRSIDAVHLRKITGRYVRSR